MKLKEESKKNKPKVETLKECINLKIPKSVINKIQFLCKEIPRDEWSGVLFYSIEGSIKDPSNMKIHLKDILPLDKGNKTYTSYKLDNVLIDFVMDNPEYAEYKWGHIHSHNDMGVFFSGTDMDEVVENSESHNFYLSLITNNYLDFEAKVVFRAKSEVEVIYKSKDLIANDENGEPYVLIEGDEDSYKEIEEKVFVHDCNIITKSNTLRVPDTFKKSVESIINKTKKSKTNTDSSPRKWPLNNTQTPVRYWDYEEKKMVSAQEYYKKYGNSVNVADNSKKGSEDLDFFKEEEESILELNFNYENDELEEALISVFKASNPPSKGETLEFVIADLCIGNDTIDSEELRGRFVTYYLSMIEKYIPNAADDMEKFEEVTVDAIEILESYEITYPDFLSSSIMFLQRIVKSIKEKV